MSGRHFRLPLMLAGAVALAMGAGPSQAQHLRGGGGSHHGGGYGGGHGGAYGGGGHFQGGAHGYGGGYSGYRGPIPPRVADVRTAPFGQPNHHGYATPYPAGRVAVQPHGYPGGYGGYGGHPRVVPGYVVNRPRFGAVFPYLPVGFATVWLGGAAYYYANEVYYQQAPGGYVVVQPPVEPGYGYQGADPQGQAAPATWYYCESAQAYYPYVNSCAEGWRAVPAMPPAPR